MTPAKPKIVFLGPDVGWDAVKAAIGEQSQLARSHQDAAALAMAIVDADALVDAAIRIPITDDMIRAAKNLKVISCASTGTDHVARTEVANRKIVVRTLRDAPHVIAGLTPAAELTWALIMACARRLVPAVQHVKAGQWVREEFPGMMLNGRQIGLVGCGRIGGWIARYAQAFGMTVVGHDPHQADLPAGVTRMPIAELVATSDVVTIHVPLAPETQNLLSADLVAKMKSGSILINTSRGSIVHESALLAGLREGRIVAAGLDVLSGEPDIADHPLVRYARDHDNLLITPHCGGFSPDAVSIVSAHAAREAMNLLFVR